MQEPVVLLPVTCPTCGTESLSEFPLLVVVTALTRWNHMALYSTCHGRAWDASAIEIQKIRAHLGATWLSEQGVAAN